MPAASGHVTVVGGGIAGLAAAVSLSASGLGVTLRERSHRLGGHLHATPFAGREAVDESADAFLARVPDGVALAGEIGLGDDLVEPAVSTASIWTGELHDIPGRTVLGVPGSVRSLLATSVLSWRGKARALTEPLRPRHDAHDSLGALVRRRFGHEVHDRLVDSLVGSIYAADTNRLSLAMVPQLEALSRSRSMLLSAGRALATPRPGPVFLTPRGGMGALAMATAARARTLGAELRTGDHVTELTRDGGRWRVDGKATDAVILACPATAAASLLMASEPALAAGLDEVEAADVVIITVAVDAATWPARLRGRSGYLVPKSVQDGVTAVSFATQKWAHLADGQSELLRISLGRDGMPIAGFTDDELLTIALAEVSGHLAFDLAPSSVRISRWPRAFPQYRPGHPRWLHRLDAATPPGIALAGASYRGVGVPACITSGRRAAASTLTHLGVTA